MSLKNLEEELGVEIFERKKGILELTYAGELFCHWAEDSLRSKQILSDQLSDISSNARHKIRLGISPHRSLILLPDVLTDFYKTADNCDLQIVEEPTYLLREMLEDDQLDLIIDVPHPDTINYQSELVAREQILLAAPKAMDKQLQKNLTLDGSLRLTADLKAPFILLTEKQIIGQISQRIFETSNFRPLTSITCSNIETALVLTAQGLGITFTPEIFVKQNRFTENISYYPIDNFQNTRQLCLVYRKNNYQNRHLKILLNIFRNKIPTLYS